MTVLKDGILTVLKHGLLTVLKHGLLTVLKHGLLTVLKHGLLTVLKHGLLTVLKHGLLTVFTDRLLITVLFDGLFITVLYDVLLTCMSKINVMIWTFDLSVSCLDTAVWFCFIAQKMLYVIRTVHSTTCHRAVNKRVRLTQTYNSLIT